MSLAIFDLDDTLLSGDSDYLWGHFLVERGIVDGEHYERENERFFGQYKAGTLNIHEWLNFQLRPLADNPLQTMLELRSRFLDEIIAPIVSPAARKLIQDHRDQRHTLLIVTATNAFITRPIAEMLGIRICWRANRIHRRPLHRAGQRHSKLPRRQGDPARGLARRAEPLSDAELVLLRFP